MKAMPVVLISAVILVGWWLSSGVEFFTQNNEVAKQTGRLDFLKKQFEQTKAQMTEERLDAMMTQVEDLDSQTQTLMENMKTKTP